MGGRVLSLRWILEGPEELLTQKPGYNDRHC